MEIISAATRYRLLSGFDDPLITPEIWNRLLKQSPSSSVFQTCEWQKTWWAVYGTGKLLIILAEHDSIPVSIAPLYADGGMVYFVGSGGSDYLDFIGSEITPKIISDFLGI